MIDDGTKPRWFRSRRFDLLVGVLLPILILVIDPVVFRDDRTLPQSLYGPYKTVAYGATALFMAALVYWVKTKRHPALLAGMLGSGMLFALLMGLAILPFSLIGIAAYGLGLLGLTPFLMAYVYGRHAKLAFRASRTPSVSLAAWAVTVAGFLFPLAFAPAAHQATWAAFDYSVGRALRPRHMATEVELIRIRLIAPFIDLDQLVSQYRQLPPWESQELRDTYRMATGEDIEARITRPLD